MKTYKFEELSNDQQQILIDRKIEHNSDEFEVDCVEWFLIKCKERGFEVEESNISYSGFSRQGDGASFIGNVDMEIFMKYLEDKKDIIVSNEVRKFYIDSICTIFRKSSNYCHSNTCAVDFEYDSEEDCNDDSIEQLVEDSRQELCSEFYSTIEEMWDDGQNEDKVKQLIIEDNYWYDDELNDYIYKPYPIYDYEIFLHADKIKENNLSLDDIKEIASLQAERIWYLNKKENEKNEARIINIIAIISDCSFKIAHIYEKGLNNGK
jgi:hypothetical protein